MTEFLIDKHGRMIDYLRVSITDLCNFRCVYCRPPEGVPLITHGEILRYEEIVKIVETAKNLGIRKVRVTGGEPLVRRECVNFISMITAMDGIEDVGLTTNGAMLGRYAHALRNAGLKRVNISLDSLRRDTFRAITGSDKLDEVLTGIETALHVGFAPVKINVVLLAGVNEDDVPEFARMTFDKPIDVRFIERMPFGDECPADAPEPFSSTKALDLIKREVGAFVPVDRDRLDGPATMYRLKGAAGRIGVIDPITGHFCGTCNRLRLTARGTLRPCLLSQDEIDVKTPLRAGASDEELGDIIRDAVNAKPIGSCAADVKDVMNQIGG